MAAVFCHKMAIDFRLRLIFLFYFYFLLQQMDPKSRPTFDDLVTQLEQMRQNGGWGVEGSQVAVAAPENHLLSPSAAPSQPPDAEASCHLHHPEDAKKTTNPASSKFDHNVYLVPGSSPSEKARCHYLHGHPKEKLIK